MRARAVNPRKPGEMSKPEMEWVKYDWFVANFAFHRYEAFTLRVGKVRYTPDFSAVCMETGQLCFFEIKAGNHPAVFTPIAKVKLKVFASEYGELRFFVACQVKPKGTWEVSEIGNETCRLDKISSERVES